MGREVPESSEKPLDKGEVARYLCCGEVPKRYLRGTSEVGVRNRGTCRKLLCGKAFWAIEVPLTCF
jgi:hypothetical protein